MRKTTHILALALFLAAGARAEEALKPAENAAGGPAAGAAALKAAFDDDTLELLRARRYVVFQGKKGAERLVHARWSELKALAARSGSVAAFSQAYARYLGEEAAAPAALPFAGLAELPDTGLMTPVLHQALRLLTAANESLNSLTPKALEMAQTPTFFEASWGETIAARSHLDVAEDVSSAADLFFEELLAGPKPHQGAQKHFQEHVAKVYQKDVAAQVAADQLAARLSDDLREALKTYFLDQRHLYALRLNGKRLAALDRRSRGAADLRELEVVAGALLAHPDALAAAESALGRAAPAGRAKLTFSGLHLEQRPGRLEASDKIRVSGAYWVDGLPEGESAAVELTSFAEAPEGIGQLAWEIVNRANGGPYSFEQTVAIEGHKPFSFRFILGVDEGAPLTDALTIPVSSDLQQALLKAAQAQAVAQSCDFKAAEPVFERLEKEIAGAAKEKKSYARLLNDLQMRKRNVRRHAAAVEKIAELTAKSAEDLSEKECRYDAASTRSAIKLTRSLPPGCDGLLPKLLQQRDWILRRLDNQRVFQKAVEKGRELKSECRFAEAAELWGGALAVLDGDPAARCGPTAKLAEGVEAEVISAKVEGERHSQFGARLAAVQKDADAPALRELSASAAVLPTPSCFAGPAAQAQKILASLGESMLPPADADILKLISQGTGVAAALDKSKKVSDAVKTGKAPRPKLRAKNKTARPSERGQSQAPEDEASMTIKSLK